MTVYIPLGSRGPVTGKADTTGKNPGKWTVTFDPSTMNCNVPYFEVCHIVVNGTAGSSFDVFVDLQKWDTNQNGAVNLWDPAIAISLRPGQYLYFYYSDNVSDNTPPTVTIWLRYDQDIRANQRDMHGQTVF